MSTATGARSGAGELLADRAYVELRDQIITLAIPPGAPLDEEALGRALQLGRTPLREAVKRLALENLVSVYPRRGTFVAEINITDLAHISDVRVELEGHASYRAAQRLTPEQRAELGGLLAELAEPGTSAAADLMELDARIHRFVYRCAGNPYLRDTLERYLNLSLRIWYLVLGRLPHLFERVHEHAELLEAIRDGEADRARAIATDHVETFEREIRGVL
ncbi:MAG TPA: GntR family transcriptional regulator [Solirubrobacteraceae bacterium]|nr:GntR family transcriptional regulator [Solirubrobacteraceae bacterium]